MIQVATSRIFLFFALLLATILVVSGVSMFAMRADTVDTKEANSWSIARVVSFFQRALPGDGSPSPTSEESPAPLEEDTAQTNPGNVLGVSTTSVRAFPPVVYAAYPPSPFAAVTSDSGSSQSEQEGDGDADSVDSTPASEAVAPEGQAVTEDETAPDDETLTEGEEEAAREPKKLGYIPGTEPTPSPTAAPVAS